MPRLRKALFNNHVYFVTCSVESGIMLPANPLVSFLIKSAIIRAQMHHPIIISHLIVNGTHLHMIVRVVNPEDLCGFMERFKTESAHYLNRLLGRKKRTVWCSGYDSPCLLELEDVLEKIVYLYTNPVKDGLINSINNYPGISTWQKFKRKSSLLKGCFLARDNISSVNQESGLDSFIRYKRLLSKHASKPRVIMVIPDDWMKAFGVVDVNAVNQEIFEMISKKEEEIFKEIEQQQKTFMGALKLFSQGINLNYQPNRMGKKMWCLSKNREARKSYISWVKSLASEATDVYKKWIKGETSLRIPTGMFAPRMPVLANLIFLD